MLYEYAELDSVTLLEGGWKLQTDGVFSKVFGNCLIVLPTFETDYPETKCVWVFATRGRRVYTRFHRDMRKTDKKFTAYDIIRVLNDLPAVLDSVWLNNGVVMNDEPWYIDNAEPFTTGITVFDRIQIEECISPECLQFQTFLHTKNIPQFIFPD